MVGRAVSLRVDRGRSHPGDVVLEVSGAARDGRPAARGVCRASTSPCARARSSASRASAATGRTSWSSASSASASPPADRSAWRPRHHALERRRATRPGDRVRARRPPALRAGAPVSGFHDNFVLTRYAEPPFAGGLGGFVRQDRPIRAEAERLAKEFDVRAPSLDVAGRHAVRWQSAEGRRRARVPPRPEGARARSADARPRRRQHRVHPQAGDRHAATPASRSSSSPRSSTRCSTSPTASWSCTAAASSAASRPPRHSARRSACSWRPARRGREALARAPRAEVGGGGDPRVLDRARVRGRRGRHRRLEHLHGRRASTRCSRSPRTRVCSPGRSSAAPPSRTRWSPPRR